MLDNGDSTLVVSPFHKTLLIDGGEGVRENIGTYLLNRRVNQIDYMIISHFDSDHVQGLFTVLEEAKVKTVIISKQGESSENYESFLEIVNRKKIKIIVVKAGDIIYIDKVTYFHVLFPEEEQIPENILNNNSIVGKLVYGRFSTLFTGDIEAIAENEIVSKYVVGTGLVPVRRITRGNNTTIYHIKSSTPRF